TLREAVEAGESGDKLKTKLTPLAKDDVAQGCLQSFLFLVEPLNADKLANMLSQFSKFLFNKKESLPKSATQTKQSKDTPRWDRVVKQTVLITDEPTQDIEVNPLEEETEPVETDWHEGVGDTDHSIEPDAGEPEGDEDIADISEIP